MARFGAILKLEDLERAILGINEANYPELKHLAGRAMGEHMYSGLIEKELTKVLKKEKKGSRLAVTRELRDKKGKDSIYDIALLSLNNRPSRLDLKGIVECKVQGKPGESLLRKMEKDFSKNYQKSVPVFLVGLHVFLQASKPHLFDPSQFREFYGFKDYTKKSFGKVTLENEIEKDWHIHMEGKIHNTNRLAGKLERIKADLRQRKKDYRMVLSHLVDYEDRAESSACLLGLVIKLK